MSVVKKTSIKKNPLVSAIVAAYNEEIHLADCIKSLLKQKYPRKEIIIVENGESKDLTYEIAKQFASKHKNVKAFSIPGKQKGPGNAWNFGVKQAKGEIIMIVGADLRYSENYLARGLKPIIQGKSVGINHKEEICDNVWNIWARAFFYKRSSEHKPGLSRIFSIIRKEYLIKRPFNSDLGYADDQTIYKTEGTEFPTYDLKVFHTNPASFSDTWDHSRWVGKSILNSWKIIVLLPIFPIYALYKSLKHLRVDFYFPFILFLPIYYSIRYFAYFVEAIKKVI